MKNTRHIWLIFISFLLAGTFPSHAQDAKEIFSKATEVLSMENVEIAMTIDITDEKGRLKSKELTVLLAKFGNEEKTKVIWQKPERAKGTTIIITEIPEQTGVIEVYTPSNGKTRKLKATDENKNMMGAEFNMTSFANYNPEELSYKLLGDTIIQGNACYRIEVRGKNNKEVSGAELVVSKSTYHILETTTFNEKHKQVSTTQLLDYKKVSGSPNKMYPMRIVTKDYKNNKDIVINIIDINTNIDVKLSDFTL